MIYFALPPTRDRYVAEVRNVLNLWSRPVCIVGPPRASALELSFELGGRLLSGSLFRVDRTLVRVGSDHTLIY